MQINSTNNVKPNFKAQLSLYGAKELLPKGAEEILQKRVKQMGSKDDFVCIALSKGSEYIKKKKKNFLGFSYVGFEKVNNTFINFVHYFKSIQNNMHMGQLGKTYGSQEQQIQENFEMIDSYLTKLDFNLKLETLKNIEKKLKSS